MKFFKPETFGIDSWFDKVYSDKANALLKEWGKVVYGTENTSIKPSNNGRVYQWYESPTAPMDNSYWKDTHRALLINIEPLAADTMKKCLEDLLVAWDDKDRPMPVDKIIERARKLLAKKGE